MGMYGRVDNWRGVVTAFSEQAETGDLPPGQQAAPGHKDGWGLTLSNARRTAMVPLVRQLGSAFTSSGFREALEALPAQPAILLCHLRKASESIPVTLSNTHPFVHNGWALIHNGTLHQAEALPRDPALVLTSDDSDTEHFFHYLLTKISARPSERPLSEVIVDAVKSLSLDYTALNFMLSNGRDLYVLRDFRKWEDYYSLHCYQLTAGVVICSQPIASAGLDPDRRTLIPGHCLLRIHGSPPQIEKYQY